jgi:hypothetical protein
MKADGTITKHAGKGSSIAGFTYLRLCPQLLDMGRKYFEFMRFAQEMRSGYYFPRWGAPPLLKQSRRDNVTDHHAFEVDDNVHELMVQLGGVPLYPASQGPGEGVSRVPKPAAATAGNKPFFKVPRVMSGIQAGARAGRNGRSNLPDRTIRFRIVENPTEEELRQHEAQVLAAKAAEGGGGEGGAAATPHLDAGVQFGI